VWAKGRPELMSVDFSSLNNVLKHPIRRRIVVALSERENMSYVDLMNLVEATNTGKFNYHLKILGDLIEKNQDGKYVLTEKGRLAAQFLQKFPEKESPKTSLHMADAMLIGFAGCALAVANPGFWVSIFVAALNVNVTWPLLSFIILLDLILFPLILPGSAMWLLTVRRAHSHDPYDLFKPPLVTFMLLLLLLVIMFFSGADLTVTIVETHMAGYTYHELHVGLTTILLFSLVLSFFGVVIAESASRIRKRLTR
jgi:hypothetical protein